VACGLRRSGAPPGLLLPEAVGLLARPPAGRLIKRVGLQSSTLTSNNDTECQPNLPQVLTQLAKDA
jgi:hypothetical protein